MAEPEEQRKLPAENTKKIRVTGFPYYAQAHEIESVFSDYGSLTIEKVTHKFANLTFSKVEEAAAALRDSNKVVLYGNFLTVTPCVGDQAHQENQAKPNKSRQPNNLKQRNADTNKRRYGQNRNKKIGRYSETRSWKMDNRLT